MEITAQFVVSHANKQRKRGKNPSLQYKGERNPRKALLLALAEIERSKSLPRRRRTMLRNPISPIFGIGSGNYCPDCGGPCGNEKHARRW